MVIGKNMEPLWGHPYGYLQCLRSLYLPLGYAYCAQASAADKTLVFSEVLKITSFPRYHDKK